MNSRLPWDDFRLILAVARGGTLSAAGRRLGLSHATVFRRLGRLEARLGVRLFDRDRTGYAPTSAGEELAAAARRIEAEVAGVERRIVGRDLRPTGTLRVTTTDTLLIGLLSPVLAEFRKAYPEIDLEIAISNELFNLAKREADIAIRPSMTPPETLVGRRIATIAQAVYGQRDCVPPDAGGRDLKSLTWVGADERMVYRELDEWMAERQLQELCRYRVDTVLGMFAAARDGAGVAVLPCYLCDGEAELCRIGEIIPALSTDLWMLTHSDLRQAARVRAFLDFVAKAVRRQRARLAGDM